MRGAAGRKRSAVWLLFMLVAGSLVAQPFAIARLASARAAGAECGYERVQIIGTAHETAAACAGLRSILAYFGAIGFIIVPEFELHFSERVYVTLYSGSVAGKGEEVQVSGYFDAGRKYIEVTSLHGVSRPDRRPWGLDWSSEIARSVLDHELAHMAVWEVLRHRFAQTPKEWLEYLAAAVQFDVMDAALRHRILSANPDISALAGPEQVNPMIYGFDPDGFAIRAHLHAKANGGSAYIARLIKGDLLPQGLGTDVLWVQ